MEKIKIILIILTILLILEFVKVNLDILETYINLFKKKEYKTTFEKITFFIVITGHISILIFIFLILIYKYFIKYS